ncbi:MAG TPA: NOB1 family endonuclease [Methanoculleus sp.]|nr:NOB1 family endonuclease [Methanoculleus sp.]
MIKVLDASAFFIDLHLAGPLFTTPAVADEIKDLAAKCRFDACVAAGLTVAEGSAEALGRVLQAAERSGDAGVISDADAGILALALDLQATLVTDDFAVQNVAHRLGIAVQPILQRKAKPRTWKYRCSGCGRYFGHPGICEYCGAEIRRKLK